MPPEIFPGGFSFNQYLVVDDKPLLFHTGPKKLFRLVSEQIEKVIPLAQLRYVPSPISKPTNAAAFRNSWLARRRPNPCADTWPPWSRDRSGRLRVLAMEDGQVLVLGRHTLCGSRHPHLPHGWECGYFFDQTTETLFCGDLFTQPGTGEVPLVTATSLAPARPSASRRTTFRTRRNALR